MLRLGIHAISGLCIGIVLGALIGGILGFSHVHLNHPQSPNGNPTEVEFHNFLVNGSSIFLAIVFAGFGSAIGAVLGTAFGAVTSVLSKRNNATHSKSNSVRNLPGLAEQSDPPKSPVSREFES
jgi:hypothetical protein